MFFITYSENFKIDRYFPSMELIFLDFQRRQLLSRIRSGNKETREKLRQKGDKEYKRFLFNKSLHTFLLIPKFSFVIGANASSPRKGGFAK